MFFPEEEEEEEILETINNKHRKSRALSCLRDSNTNKRIKEERGGFDSIVQIHGQAP